ncbi:MAG TPA: OadG family protein [Bacteroidales bacterium]|nr:OadG family protein [Bacteroidales bacterium]
MNYMIGLIQVDYAEIADSGLTIALVGWLIVFAALVLLVIIFNQTPKLIYYNTRKKMRQQSKNEIVTDTDLIISGDVSAAIAMALHMYYDDIHDLESNVITIKQVRKTYSPWSSKIYGLRVWPQK